MTQNIVDAISTIIPDIILVFGCLISLIFGVFVKDTKPHIIGYIMIIALLISLNSCLSLSNSNTNAISGGFTSNKLIVLFKLFLFVVGIICITIFSEYYRISNQDKKTYNNDRESSLSLIFGSVVNFIKCSLKPRIARVAIKKSSIDNGDNGFFSKLNLHDTHKDTILKQKAILKNEYIASSANLKSRQKFITNFSLIEKFDVNNYNLDSVSNVTQIAKNILKKSFNSIGYEIPILMVFSLVGMSLAISSNDLITLYLSIELSSLSIYICVASNLKSSRSTEAGLKFLILGTASSGLYLFGVSLIYGFVGSVNFQQILHFSVLPEIAQFSLQNGLSTGDLSSNLSNLLVNISPSNSISSVHFSALPFGMIIGSLLSIFGILFKLAVVPFHIWAPDVYQGTSKSIISLIATASKITGVAVLIRLMYGPFINVVTQLQDVMMIVAILSICIGSLVGIVQSDLKRLLAYSAINHAGFILLGFVGNINNSIIMNTNCNIHDVIINGVAYSINYLFIYTITVLGLFAALSTIKFPSSAILIRDLAGIGKTNKPLAAIITILLFSMIGIPPFAGFFAKFYILSSVVNNAHYYLAIFAVVFTVISSYYYLRIIKVMYFNLSDNNNDNGDIVYTKHIITPYTSSYNNTQSMNYNNYDYAYNNKTKDNKIRNSNINHIKHIFFTSPILTLISCLSVIINVFFFINPSLIISYIRNIIFLN